jgi:hypothetical protein
MIPFIAALASTFVITPGEVPVVADVHPDETAWIEEIKACRDDIHQHVHLPAQALARQPAPIPPEEIDALIQQFFLEEDWDWARRVSLCESTWNANAYNESSGASGLFQQLQVYWDQRAEWAGWPGADVFDPVANTAVSAWLFYHPDGGPGHWVCK